MSFHPTGIQVDVVGIEAGERGRSCEEHSVCGEVLQIDSVVRFRAIQIINDQGEEETAIGAFWVTDGVDRCLVGFLPRHCIARKAFYDGELAQVVELLSLSHSPTDRRNSNRNSGVCKVALLSK